MSTFPVDETPMEPYAPRRLITLPALTHGDWDLKRYAVIYGDAPLDESTFFAGLPQALALLPTKAFSNDRLGVGFVIFHQGRDIDYLVLAWWDRENELPLRVFVRERLDAQWRASRGSESICVWDLEIIWGERNAYIQTVLGRPGTESGRERYLGASATPSTP